MWTPSWKKGEGGLHDICCYRAFPCNLKVSVLNMDAFALTVRMQATLKVQGCFLYKSFSETKKGEGV
jgi:hypothetical protein